MSFPDIKNFLDSWAKYIFKGAGSVIGSYKQSANSELTGAEREANQFSAQQAEIARDWQEKMYNQYESPQAQIRQYQDAGLNPALMYGSSGPSVSMPSTSMPSSVSPNSGNIGSPLDFMGSIMNLLKTKAEIGKIKSETVGQNISNEWQEKFNELSTEEGRARIDKTLAEVRKIESDVTVNNSVIELNGQQINLLDSQIRKNESEIVLNAAKETITNLDAEKARIAMQYLPEYYDAQNKLMRAQTRREFAEAKKLLEEASYTTLKMMVDKKLLSNGYFDQLIAINGEQINNLRWDGQIKERQFNWMPVNNVIDNLGTLATGSAAVLNSIKPWYGLGGVTSGPSFGSSSTYGNYGFR